MYLATVCFKFHIHSAVIVDNKWL